MLSYLTKLFGSANSRSVKRLEQEVEKINKLEPKMKSKADSELRAMTAELKAKLVDGKTLDSITYEAFALVREAAKRVLGQRHYDVQLIGGLVLHRGNIAEMRTGEGKTLVATLPAYLNALTGKGVHVVTVNDYLAARDSKWMGQVFEFLDLTVGCIVSGISDEARKEAYNADILYVTNNELGFDYLRDNMKYLPSAKVQRAFNFGIIDEVDSILIDEARTPLIISGPVDDNTDLHVQICKVVASLNASDYDKDEKVKTVSLTEDGITKCEELLNQAGLIAEGSTLYDFDNLSLVHYINQALKAHFIFTRDVDYLIRDDKVMIIDEFTGRVMDGRRYSDGLHQALEAKELVPIQNENQTLASITFQNYFRNYPKLGGMTGTAMTESAEFKDIYDLDVVALPTHKKVARIDHDDEIYGTIKEKYNAILALIEQCYNNGQPVLVGTVSIEKSEEISQILRDKKIPHNVLNAKQHEKEAEIIAQAGRFGAVTIATNMAGRGTDIQLGGNLDMLVDELQKGKKLTKAALDEETDKLRRQIANEKQKVLDVGGLYVIGTERHESRRIDNQLRGRSGRQGDPGATKFFLSLEDDLMRIFASERISGLLRTLGLKDGEAIQHKMISRSLERAQTKVESQNYEIRKNLLKFDDVMNDQRKIIYQQRSDIMLAEDMISFINDMNEQVIEQLVESFIPKESLRESWQLPELSSELSRLYSFDISHQQLAEIGAENEISQHLLSKTNQLMQNKLDLYGKEVLEDASRYITLSTLDQSWKDHLHHLDHLRQGISLRAYGQKDPLVEYKREAFSLFEQMLVSFRELFISRVYRLHIDLEHIDRRAMQLESMKMQEMHTSRIDPALENAYNKQGKAIETKAKTIRNIVPADKRDPNDPTTWGKIARNELCPCGSGKKYKHCHGKD